MTSRTRWSDSSRPPFRVPRILDACAHQDRLPSKHVRGDNLFDGRKAAADRVLDHCRLTLAHHLGTSPEAWVWAGRRGVRVWDAVEISVDHRGTDLRVEYVTRDAEIAPCPSRADLTSPISAFAWPWALRAQLVASCRSMGVPLDAFRSMDGTYMSRVLCRTFSGYVDWNRLRRSVLAHLRLDPLVVSLTRRTFEGDFPSVDCFNWVARNVRELALVATERPEFLPFLRFVCGLEGPPVEAFRRVMAENGMTPAASGKLVEWGFDAFSNVVIYGPGHDMCTNVAKLANLLDRLRIRGPVHRQFADLAMQDARGAPDWFLRALWCEVDALVDAVPELPIPGGLELATAWVETGPPEPDENQKRAGWPWIVAQAYKHRLEAEERSWRPWPMPFEARRVGDCDVVAMCSAVQLREEGRLMRNCLEDLAGDCASGRLLVFSIRREGKRVAAFSLQRRAAADRPWEVREIAGIGNSRVEPSMLEIAESVAASLE